MAEAVVEIVLEKLSSVIEKEVSLFLGFNQDLKRLSSLLATIKATLEAAEEKQFTDKTIKDWLQKLQDEAHILDDILDECATEALELENGGFKCGLSQKLFLQGSSCLSSLHPKHVSFCYKVAKKMKRVRERLDEIAEERSKFHLMEMEVRERRKSTAVLDWRQTTSIITQPQVYGRDEDKDRIVEFLVGDASGLEDLSVYPIIGLGGLGKTTLAQLIFNDERVVKNFAPRAWVCVSEDFSLKRMTKAIIESASGKACEDLELEPLQRRLQDLLQGKRYLLVLDDVWDDDQDNWQRLKSVLACGGKGASVLVTTRLSKVAAIMGTTGHPYELSRLSDNDCWELFKQRAFGPNWEEEWEVLLAIGKEIVKKCGGVPLATLALGSLLRFKREEKEWLYIKESKLWSLQAGGGENSVMSALRLSYLNLPVKLRQCFALCALFPKDERIDKQFLIELWVANGYISSNEKLEAEDVGNEVWSELYWRSFFQNISINQFGQVKSFKMHDLAQSVTEEVYCITDDHNGAPMSKKIRHLSIDRRKPVEGEVVDSIQFSNLKSLLLVKSEWQGQVEVVVDKLTPHILKCYSLRVLQFGGRKQLSSSIGLLRHLRYLNLSHGRFKTLPESLCTLWNLQILKLDWCTCLQKLPKRLVRLKALQHIYLNYCSSLSSMPPHARKLSSLRTLSMYIVGEKKGSLLAELGQLKLKGVLHIKRLERVKSVFDAKEANMSSKHLNHLRLSWDTNEDSQFQENVEQIMEELQPHTQQLQTLGVAGYRGARFPQWMSSCFLKDLKLLVLVDCISCSYLNDGRIFIRGGFTALENISLENMPNLVGLSREDGENLFPCLSRLQIVGCPNFLGLPCLPTLKALRIAGKCKPELLSSINKLHNLETLRLKGNDELTCFPHEMLSSAAKSLKELDISYHSKLEVLPIEIINLSKLQVLFIKSCERLESLSDEALQGLQYSLRKLDIVECPKFNLTPSFGYLTCLEKLLIGHFSNVDGLQEALQHMKTCLQSLALNELPNLVYLPDCLGNLSMLHTLRISGCPKLMCLPTTIQCLSGLKTLEIYRCPELARRCQKETGEDWPKVAHVQHLGISNGRVLCGGEAGVSFQQNGGLYYILYTLILSFTNIHAYVC